VLVEDWNDFHPACEEVDRVGINPFDLSEEELLEAFANFYREPVEEMA
jgi:hypothetical protein